MSSKRLVLLAGVTAAICAGAFFAVRSNRPQALPADPGPAMPALASRLNDAASITITRSGGAVTLTRSGEGEKAQWVIPAKASFPADLQKIRTTLLQLKDFQLAEPKTSNADYYPKLGVQDVRVMPKPEAGKETPAEAPPGAMIEIRDSGGKEIGSLIVGNAADIGNATLDRPLETGQFVRRPGTVQTWLSRGTIYLDSEPLNWIDRKVVSLPRERIQSATVRRFAVGGPQLPADAKPDLFVSRKAKDQGEFDTDPKPADKQPKPTENPDQPVVAVAFLNLEDVMKDPGGVIGNADPAAKGENAAHPAETRFLTFDGLALTVKTGFADGKWWAAVSAESTGDPVLPGSDAEKQKSDSASSVKEAEEINRRCKGWLFAISQFDAKRLSAKFDELWEPIPPPSPSTPKVGPSAELHPETQTPLPPRSPAQGQPSNSPAPAEFPAPLPPPK